MTRKRRPRTEAEIEQGKIAQTEAKEARKAQKRKKADELEARKRTDAEEGIEFYSSKEAHRSLGKANCKRIVKDLRARL